MNLLRLFALAAALAAAPAIAQEKGACVVLLMHGKGASAQAMTALANKLRPICLVRAPEMPWSSKRSDASADPLPEITKHVKELRAQNFKRVLVLGQGVAASAALAYAGKVGDIEGVVALSAEDNAQLPAVTAGIKQHVPLLWLVSRDEPLHAKGEPYAFAKAPPHPASRYVALKADLNAQPEAAGKAILDWAKSLD